MKLKLALGTAQFGMDYGLNNKAGKIPEGEALKILAKAVGNGITTVDTAYAYGDSELVIGKFIRENSAGLKVVSKAPECSAKELPGFFNNSLKRLNLPSIYGYLIHDFGSFLKDPGLWNAMRLLRQEGLAEKIGFSFYSPKEAKSVLDKGIVPDIVQVPFSVFDQRFSETIKLLKKQGVEVHARSVFLQGLVFKDPANLEKRFSKIREKLFLLQSLSGQTGVPLSAICINFAALNKNIGKVVVGVDSLSNLQENINAISCQIKVKKVYNQLLNLGENDEGIILPFNWTKSE